MEALPQPFALSVFVLSLSMGLSACSDSSDASDTKCGEFESTYAAIQQTVFDGSGCTASVCHGDARQGGLDLRADASHAALVSVSSQIDPSMERVFPGDQDRSLLYLKLLSATEGIDLGGRGQGMPADGEPLTTDQLEAIRLWIRGGASEIGIVADTLGLLGCEENVDADPNKIDPLPVPGPQEGVQFYSGGWALPAESENEVCFASYYDFSEQVPPEFRLPCGEGFEPGRECFAFWRSELAQDGLSHHSIISVYKPESDPTGGDWGEWTCLGGDRDGSPCDPTVAGTCGTRAQCTTRVRTSVACIAYSEAPDDFSDFGVAAVAGGSGTRTQLSGSQESTFIDEPEVGVYSLLPLRGFVAWNSHAFNLTTKDTTVEQWVNLTFAPSDERIWLKRDIFESGDIFAMSPVAPFSKREVCTTFTLPRYSRLMSLSSHMHERGERFRIWLPPNQPCSSPSTCEVPTRQSDYESFLYDDPVYTYYTPPLPYDGAGEADRTFRACAVYDNGADDPLEVKRESTKPNSGVCFVPFAGCGCEARERVCLGGANQGRPCGGDDSVCGQDGICDACPLYGGVTTDDEMFIPLGSYFVQEP